MSSGKLRLNLAALRLKSFETTPAPTTERGTVEGMDSVCSGCTGCTDCTQSCSAVTFCVGSCRGTYCLNASQTDSGCQVTWNWGCDG